MTKTGFEFLQEQIVLLSQRIDNLESNVKDLTNQIDSLKKSQEDTNKQTAKLDQRTLPLMRFGGDPNRG